MDGRRTTFARIGLVLLNVAVPGLGLLRLGLLRAALIWFVAPFIMLVGLGLAFAVAPTLDFRWAMVLAVVLLAWAMILWLAPMIQTWRASASPPAELRWWSRWYALIMVWIVAAGLSQAVVLWLHDYYKPFYIPADSMAPTLEQGEKLVADMRGGRHPAVGDIVLFDVGGPIYIKRVAALAGDRIAMRDGVPYINGVAARQQLEGRTVRHRFGETHQYRILTEQFPKDARVHRILDLGMTEIDNMPERIVPEGHIFVLGDNRDESADSRVGRDRNGVDMVPLSAIVGRPLFIHWSADRDRMGQPL